jgi:hypothetical protein
VPRLLTWFVERLFELQRNHVEGRNDTLSVCCRQRGEQTVSNRGSVRAKLTDDGGAALGQVNNLLRFEAVADPATAR